VIGNSTPLLVTLNTLRYDLKWDFVVYTYSDLFEIQMTDLKTEFNAPIQRSRVQLCYASQMNMTLPSWPILPSGRMGQVA